jgi:hypothetical protein
VSRTTIFAFVRDAPLDSGDTAGSKRKSAPKTKGGTVVPVARGLWLILKIAGVAIVLAILFLAGRPALPRARRNRQLSGARYLRPGVKVAPARLGVHWYAWPGWQRSLARAGLLALLAAAAYAPLVTGLSVAAALLVIGGVACAGRTRRRLAIGPRKVRAEVSAR